MLKNILMAAVAVFALVGTANAATYVIDLPSSAVASTGLSLPGNVAPAAAAVTGNAGEVTGSVANQYLAPTGVTGPYLYVGANSPTAASSATFTLNSQLFGFTWGSIDTYNTLKLTTSDLATYTFTGSDILALLSAFTLTPNGTAGGSNSGLQADVLFHAAGQKIISAVLTSQQAAFEIANMTSVPLPAAGLLFASGLAALGGVARRKSRA